MSVWFQPELPGPLLPNQVLATFLGSLADVLHRLGLFHHRGLSIVHSSLLFRHAPYTHPPSTLDPHLGHTLFTSFRHAPRATSIDRCPVLCRNVDTDAEPKHFPTEDR